ncbi:acetyl-CoA hydrolase/transferase C-terminal domain-containing protein [Desulfosporosinus sp. BICA1-9]|uniref:acetyl-CoA hydrolase/transferase family protein n=1 Tax=Desulfosporosinus sp. BICA1-9 TaxID=1531958 RepID=UPI000A7685D8
MQKILKPVMDPQAEYGNKLVTADEAVKRIKSGDRIQYGEFASVPINCDAALARRKNELNDVWISTNTLTFIPQAVISDPSHKHFINNDFFHSMVGRKLSDAGLTFYVPSAYHEAYKIARESPGRRNVAMVTVNPMDEYGFFNFGTTTSINPLIPELFDLVIVEVNTNMPRVHGQKNYLHISQIDCIIEGDNPPLMQISKIDYTETDDKIAHYIMDELGDGACLQLGIGAMPNRVGSLIAQSDIKDIGVHTEMLVDSFVDMYEAGRITNMRKNIDKGKFTFTFALGSDKLYKFVNNNVLCNAAPSDYTNDPYVIAQNDNVFSVCGCLEVDLFGQVSSESKGSRQISGVGGQFDFIYGAFRSNGGKGFCCMHSTVRDKDGKLTSRIVPAFAPSTAVTVPRYITNYVVTEYGLVNLKGKATWQRAEELINIAHPDFRDELIKQAEKMKIWRYTNKQ